MVWFHWVPHELWKSLRPTPLLRAKLDFPLNKTVEGGDHLGLGCGFGSGPCWKVANLKVWVSLSETEWKTLISNNYTEKKHPEMADSSLPSLPSWVAHFAPFKKWYQLEHRKDTGTSVSEGPTWKKKMFIVQRNKIRLPKDDHPKLIENQVMNIQNVMTFLWKDETCTSFWYCNRHKKLRSGRSLDGWSSWFQWKSMDQNLDPNCDAKKSDTLFSSFFPIDQWFVSPTYVNFGNCFFDYQWIGSLGCQCLVQLFNNLPPGVCRPGVWRRQLFFGASIGGGKKRRSRSSASQKFQNV